MKKFLQLVASDLYKKFGNKYADIAVIFPNRRAKLFFNQYLYNETQKTFWAPAYFTISDLIMHASRLQLPDNVQLTGQLYNIYKRATKTDENFSDFYFWGEILLGDFDDIDKNLVNTQQLFSNLKELKDYKNTFDFLDDEQRHALEQFFVNFSIDKNTELKKKFVDIWNVLGDIYNEFSDTLLASETAYEGLMYRTVANKLDGDINDIFSYKKYAFVGFNALNACEKKLFSALQKNDKALFYWDYDKYYLNNINNEAGFFMRDNLSKFSSELQNEDFDVFEKTKKNITIISSSTENAQVRYSTQWLNQKEISADSNSAIILCNENMLQPLLHSLPSSVSDVNITMGFPLSQTPIFTTINILIDLQTKGYDSSRNMFFSNYITNVLQNNYIQMLTPQAKTLHENIAKKNHYLYTPSDLQTDETLKTIFTKVNDINNFTQYLLQIITKIATINSGKNPLYDEAVFRAYTSINRLSDLLAKQKLMLDLPVFVRLLKRLLFTASVPFHGEPVKGLQIMGVLETRNLDFDNILLLSVNEGTMPKSGNSASFIPYNLRRAFGMTTNENRNAISAYYFYRLLQRAKNITITYNTSTEGLNRGEMSRFALQLMLESPFEITQKNIQTAVSLSAFEPIVVQKTPEMLQHLKNIFGVKSNKSLSPSALNNYIDCPLKFYFKAIARLKPTDKIDNEIDAITFGNVFHKSAEAIYLQINKFENDIITAQDLDAVLKDTKIIESIVDKVFGQIVFNGKDTIAENEFNGLQLIIRNVAIEYIKKLLQIDKAYAPFTMLKSEQTILQNITFDVNGEKINLNIGGIIDRRDLKGNTLRVLDYKTGGGKKNKIKSCKDLFVSAKGRDSYAFQVILYSAILRITNTQQQIMPTLLFIQKTSASEDSNSMQIIINKNAINNIADVYDEFMLELNKLIAEIFDINIPFTQTSDKNLCTFCEFCSICKTS